MKNGKTPNDISIKNSRGDSACNRDSQCGVLGVHHPNLSDCYLVRVYWEVAQQVNECFLLLLVAIAILGLSLSQFDE